MDDKKMEQFNAFVQSLPITLVKNPYWAFDDDNKQILNHIKGGDEQFNIAEWRDILVDVRTYFRHVFDGFDSEAQVLCVAIEDADKLHQEQIPSFPKTYFVGEQEIVIFVLPQYNTFGITTVSESFWQTKIIGQDIHPVARIHSHHILDPYQSATDYASLNSNTLELVIGRIYGEFLSIGYWLDVRSTDTKDNVWVAIEDDSLDFEIRQIDCGRITDINKKNYKTERGN